MVSVRNKTTSIELIQKFTWQTCDAQHPIHQSAKKMEKIVIIVPFVLLLSQSGCGRVMSEKTHRTGRTHHFLGAWYHFPSHHYLMSFGSSCRPHRRSPPPPHRLVVVYLGIWKRERLYCPPGIQPCILWRPDSINKLQWLSSQLWPLWTDKADVLL